MSLPELVEVEAPAEAALVEVELAPPPALVEVELSQGPPGPPGQWVSLTQAEYDALAPPDPETLYVIVE